MDDEEKVFLIAVGLLLMISSGFAGFNPVLMVANFIMDDKLYLRLDWVLWYFFGGIVAYSVVKKYENKMIGGPFPFLFFWPPIFIVIASNWVKFAKKGGVKIFKMPRIFRYSVYAAIVTLVWKFTNNIDHIVSFFVTNYFK